MSRKNFMALRPYLQRKITRLREPISVETQVAAFLYYISDEGRKRIRNILSRNFQVVAQTIGKSIFHTDCQALESQSKIPLGD